MNVRQRGAARRYAKALLEVALDSGDAEAVRDQLRDFVQVLSDNPELAAALAHPALDLDRKQAVAREVLARLGSSVLVGRLVNLLMTRGRMDLLPDIAEAYAADWNDHRGVLQAEAVTAVALGDAQEKSLAAALATASGRGVELVTSVDPEVLGGVRVTMGGRIYDGTVRGRLQGLRRHLEGN
jgi:F-type H+-transporting ATPase subunit delta